VSGFLGLGLRGVEAGPKGVRGPGGSRLRCSTGIRWTRDALFLDIIFGNTRELCNRVLPQSARTSSNVSCTLG